MNKKVFMKNNEILKWQTAQNILDNFDYVSYNHVDEIVEPSIGDIFLFFTTDTNKYKNHKVNFNLLNFKNK
jgi:hypothetical protein